MQLEVQDSDIIGLMLICACADSDGTQLTESSVVVRFC